MGGGKFLFCFNFPGRFAKGLVFSEANSGDDRQEIMQD